ncbi:endo-1,3;1,4-beta-D-glucanase-like [Wolffia australiana]
MAGEQCCENPPVLDVAAGVGVVDEDVGGLRCYVSGDIESTAAIILASDIFGFEAPNLRKLADKVAAAGFFVVVPDFFNGDPYVPDNPDKPIKDWLQIHSPEKSYEKANNLVNALKSKGLSSFAAAGFCWGAKLVTELAKSGEIIETGVMLVTLEDIEEVKIPLAILAAEIDSKSPPALIKQFEEILSKNKQVESFVKIYPGVAHGWTIRYDDKDEIAVGRAEEAHQDLLNWLNKILKHSPLTVDF